MIELITNHPIITGAIVFFVIASVFTYVEAKHAAKDPSDDKISETE